MARDDYINTMPRVLTHPIRCACAPSNYLSSSFSFFFCVRTKTCARVFKMAVHSGGTVVWPPRNWPKGASVGQLGSPRGSLHWLRPRRGRRRCVTNGPMASRRVPDWPCQGVFSSASSLRRFRRSFSLSGAGKEEAAGADGGGGWALPPRGGGRFFSPRVHVAPGITASWRGGAQSRHAAGPGGSTPAIAVRHPGTVGIERCRTARFFFLDSPRQQPGVLLDGIAPVLGAGTPLARAAGHPPASTALRLPR